MFPTVTCPLCGGSVTSGGLCPKCLFAAALDSPQDGDETLTHLPDASIQKDFGPYTILRKLGEGGMGVVYLAEQREPIRRRVALKVVKPGMDGTHVLGRFAHERQSLAMVEHPNIARILDAGVSADGRPYFAMEYVEGQPITRYCDSRKLTIRQRLELFLSVCRAVQHAHQKGVIHRDIKPSNILVTEQDGTPLPKVIDFGIAKGIGEWTKDLTTLTQAGQMIGTPEYASPEQMALHDGEVDERSDVYSLGVTLYELLIGAVPFGAAQMRGAGLSELLRIILNEEAPPLSSKFSSLGDAATQIASNRQMDPGSLRCLVDGDLNLVTLKAIEKSRDRRYASVAGFAADIQQYLDPKAVRAAPPSVWYRASRFVQSKRTALLAGTAAAALIALAGVALWQSKSVERLLRQKLTANDAIVLADFDNRTGDATFDDALRARLSMELQDWPQLSLVSDSRVRRQLELMGKSKEAKVTAEAAQQICERIGSSAVLEGSIALVGSQFVVGLTAKVCGSGSVIYHEQAVVNSREEVLGALTQISRKLREKAGDTLAAIEKRAAPAEATTASMEALRAYSIGLKTALTLGNAQALPFYRRAVEIDPNFAMAYAALGLSYHSIGESELAIEPSRKAWQLRSRVSERERFFIEFAYDRHVTGNLEKTYQTLEAWKEAFPSTGQQPNPHSLLTGLATNGTGRYEVAARAGEAILAREPDMKLMYATLASSYFLTSRFDQLDSVVKRAAAQKVARVELLAVRYMRHVLDGDTARMNEVLAEAKGKRRTEHLLAHLESLALARAGKLQAARIASNRALELALQEGDKENAADYRAARAWWEALIGDAARAKNEAAGVASFKGKEVQYVAGMAWAATHGLSLAETVASSLEKRFPEDTFSKFSYVPALRGLIALDRRQPGEAVEALEISRRYEFAANGLTFNRWILGGLHSAFVRGQAFAALGRHAEAVAEFEKVLTHRGLVGLDPIGAASYVHQARAAALAGHRQKAAASYQAFLTLWKEADPEAPLLRQVRKEFQALQQ